MGERDPLLEHAISVARQRRRQSSGGRAAHLAEDDHIAGQTTWGSLKIRLWRDDHRTTSELRRILGFDRLPPADDDPLLLMAHLIAGLATLLALLVDYLVTWAAVLRERHGAAYAAGLPSPVVP